MKRREGEPEWETVVVSDDQFSETDTEENDQSSQLLHTPEFTLDTLAGMERDASQSTQEGPAQPEAPAQRGEPGQQVACEICGKQARVKRDGTLGAHGKCEAPPSRGNRFANLPAPKPAPRKVRDFSISVVAWGLEETSALVLSRATGVDAQDIPTDLPDAEEMIGPPLDILWPHIPETAQEFIGMLADNSQLISCALTWGEWIKNLSAWTRDARAYQRSLTPEGQGQSHGATSYATGTGQQYGTVTPFQPRND